MSGQDRRFFEEKSGAAGESLSLNEPNARIIHSVLRLAEGDQVVLLDGRGGIAKAELLDVGKARATARIVETKRVTPPFPDITLLQGLPKGEKSSWIVQKSVEFGASRILFFESGHTIGKKGAGQADRWKRVAIEAMRQSGNPHLPLIQGPFPLNEALERVGEGTHKFVLDEAEKNARFRRWIGSGSPSSICVAVGPEGGWSDSDRKALASREFQAVGVGPFTLRTETAAVAALAALRAWLP